MSKHSTAGIVPICQFCTGAILTYGTTATSWHMTQATLSPAAMAAT